MTIRNIAALLPIVTIMITMITMIMFTSNNPIDVFASAGGVENEDKLFPAEAGGDPIPYWYSAEGLPAGITIDGKTGVISGTPTHECSAGTGIVTAMDGASQVVSITINYGAVSKPKEDVPDLKPPGASATLPDAPLTPADSTVPVTPVVPAAPVVSVDDSAENLEEAVEEIPNLIYVDDNTRVRVQPSMKFTKKQQKWISRNPDIELYIVRNVPIISLGSRAIPIFSIADARLWALSNAVFALTGFIIMLVSILRVFSRKKNLNAASIAIVVPAVAGVVMFFVLSDVDGTMTLFDEWSPLAVGILSSIMFLSKMSHKKKNAEGAKDGIFYASKRS